MTTDPRDFDPWALISALEKHRVNYVLIGDFAGVLHGTDELAVGIEICPQMKAENIERLQGALAELDGQIGRRAVAIDAEALAAAEVTRIETPHGDVAIVPEPAGSKGWDDVRRGTTREAIGRGLRASVASVDDLARLMTSRGHAVDPSRLAVLRRLAELDRGRGISR